MRWLPGTRILTWVDGTGARPRGYQQVDAPPTGGGARPASDADGAARARSPRRPGQAPPAEHVEVEVGHGVRGVLAHVEHQPVAALGDALGPRPPGGPPRTCRPAPRRRRARRWRRSSMWRRGTTSTCTGAWGLRSRKATACSERSHDVGGDLAGDDAAEDAVPGRRVAHRRRARAPTGLGAAVGPARALQLGVEVLEAARGRCGTSR